MEFKYNIKQRTKTIQGLRSFKDTLPKKIKSKSMSKSEHINKISTIKNEKIKNSLIELSKLYKKK